MSKFHSGCKQGTRVKLLFKDGSVPVITKFKEEKARHILTSDGKFQIKKIRSMLIYKPQNHERNTASTRHV